MLEGQVPPKINHDIMNQLSDALGGIKSANGSLGVGGSVEMHFMENKKDKKTEGSFGSPSNIQKRGLNYPGDSNFGWGLNGTGFHGSTAPSQLNPFYGRGPHLGFQGGIGLPFGLGNGYTRHGGNHSSINGGGTAVSPTSSIAHAKMSMAVEVYRGFGVIKNVIDLMCNFASEGFTIQHTSKKVRNFYRRWAEHVDLEGRIKDILRYYYKYGNVFIYTTMGKIDEGAYNRMKSAKGDTSLFVKSDSNDPAQKEKIKDIEKEAAKPEGEREIPWRYTLLNPFQMDLRGTKFFGEQKWVFVLDETTITDMNKKRSAPMPSTKLNNDETKTPKSRFVDFLDESDVNLPPEFKKMREGRIVELDQAKLWTLHYMKDDHEDWADPMIWPVINDVMYKNKLRAMDISACDSVINAITLFKLGNLKEGFVASKEHYDQLAEMLRTPTAAMTMVWNDAIEIESNYPPIEKILGAQKYESVDNDILAGLGISEVIVNGRGGNYASSFLSVRTLLERLEEGRREVKKWVRRQLKTIAAIMGHRTVPTIEFGKMSLRDEQKEKQLVMSLLDRNVISIEAVHDTFGLDFDIERQRLKNEKEIADSEGIFQQHGPFKDPLSEMTEIEKFDREDDRMEKVEEIKMREKKADKRANIRQQKQNVRTGGRPSGTKDIPQEKKRETKPQGMGFIQNIMAYKVDAQRVYDIVEKDLTSRLLKSRGVSYKKSLSKENRNSLESLITHAVGCVSLKINKSDGEVIAHAAQSKPNKFFVETLNGMLDKFTRSHGREPNAAEARDMTVTARAIIEEYSEYNL